MKVLTLMLSGRAPKIVWSGDRYDPRWSSAAVSEWVSGKKVRPLFDFPHLLIRPNQCVWCRLTKLGNLLDPREGGRQWCLHQASESIFGFMWPWPLSLWPPNSLGVTISKVEVTFLSWSFHLIAPSTTTTCADWHQNRFIRFQNIMFTSLATDGRTDMSIT